MQAKFIHKGGRGPCSEMLPLSGFGQRVSKLLRVDAMRALTGGRDGGTWANLGRTDCSSAGLMELIFASDHCGAERARSPSSFQIHVTNGWARGSAAVANWLAQAVSPGEVFSRSRLSVVTTYTLSSKRRKRTAFRKIATPALASCPFKVGREILHVHGSGTSCPKAHAGLAAAV